MVKTDYFSSYATRVISGVYDFEVIDNYMFATVRVSMVHVLASIVLCYFPLRDILVQLNENL